MRGNPARRRALIDAAIEVLAREGARGLTFRAVDTEAGVPQGTASNYFPSRDDLFDQIGGRVHERFTPEPSGLAETMRARPTRELVTVLMRQLIERLSADPHGYLALVELRLEATRRPKLRAVLTDLIGANIDENVRFHLDSGLPGDRITVVLLQFAMSWLMVEHLTLPGLFERMPAEDLVAAMVDRLVPDA
ncbi:TetR/AcrR family transcriptional regulator [Amycolatopsis minnesotensis]|uniref:TetR/AcrR family transcriptional regulator n=1 Tax=Amycolatopsis minnesotensis TaxID=337894 RepID=A0ABP5BEV9_9PSEU